MSLKNKSEFPQEVIQKEGVLYFENGEEIVLWGHNFQPNLYWEYGFRMKHLGLPMDLDTMKAMCDDGLEDMKRMKSHVVRCHLTPADFSDAEGNLVDTIWLEMLGYLLARCREEGIYVYLTFLNQMNYTFVEGSFIAHATREEWIFDPDVVAQSQNCIRQLLNYKNPYNDIVLKEDTVIAVWELINEPEYLTWDQMQESEKQKALYKVWTEEKSAPFNDVYFQDYQYETVLRYINGMSQLFESEGADKPLIWNCNWPRMIVAREKIFDAIADSKADGISFCLYPGQDEVGVPFTECPENMSERNFFPFLEKCFHDYAHLGWLKEERFSGKAKLVYEFETMYGAESAYLHPAMAKLFRALGVQMATCWTHTFNVYAEHQGGSHVLNMRSTPKKALSYIAAGEVFRNLPRQFDFTLTNDKEDSMEGVELSFDKNLSMTLYDGVLIYSNEFSDESISLPSNTTEIYGFGNSPWVQYSGSGMYYIRIMQGRVEVELFPNTQFVREPHLWYTDGKKLAQFDWEVENSFKLTLPGEETVVLSGKAGVHQWNRKSKEPLAGVKC